MFWKERKQYIGTLFFIRSLLLGCLLQAGESLRLSDGSEGPLPVLLQLAISNATQELCKMPYAVRRYVCRYKIGQAFDFNDYGMGVSDDSGSPVACCKKNYKLTTVQDYCAWQVGEGPLANQLPKEYTSGKRLTITTESGTRVNTIFHEREGADTVVFVAHGLRDNLATFAPVLWICEKASIVFFDFRAHDVDVTPKSFRGKFCRRLLNIDGPSFCLGASEEEEVLAVVNYYKNVLFKNKYKKVVGLGFCFGAAMMVKAQVKQPDLFTHLIFDSLWPHSDLLVQKFLRDPKLIVKPRKKPGGSYVRVFASKIAQTIVKKFAEQCLFGKSIDIDLDICALLGKIQVPVLFFYGNEDALITPAEFDMVWNSVLHDKKFAIINNNKHLLSFLKSRDTFKVMVDYFLRDAIKPDCLVDTLNLSSGG